MSDRRRKKIEAWDREAEEVVLRGAWLSYVRRRIVAYRRDLKPDIEVQIGRIRGASKSILRTVGGWILNCNAHDLI